MLGSASRRTMGMLAALSLLSAGGAAVWFSDLEPVTKNGKPQSLLSMLRDRSPGDRAEGASSKKAPVSAVLSERTPAAKKIIPAAVPAALASPVGAAPAIAGAALPVPVAAAPLAPAIVPAAASAGRSLFVPPLFFPGGGGGGGGITVTVTPPGGEPPVPAVPEPATWAMMIIGFGFVGGLLRRRRRIAATGQAATGSSALAVAATA